MKLYLKGATNIVFKMKLSEVFIVVVGIILFASAAQARNLQSSELTGLQGTTNDMVWKGHVLSPDNLGTCSSAAWAFAVMTAIEG